MLTMLKNATIATCSFITGALLILVYWGFNINYFIYDARHFISFLAICSLLFILKEEANFKLKFVNGLFIVSAMVLYMVLSTFSDVKSVDNNSLYISENSTEYDEILKKLYNSADGVLAFEEVYVQEYSRRFELPEGVLKSEDFWKQINQLIVDRKSGKYDSIRGFLEFNNQLEVFLEQERKLAMVVNQHYEMIEDAWIGGYYGPQTEFDFLMRTVQEEKLPVITSSYTNIKRFQKPLIFINDNLRLIFDILYGLSFILLFIEVMLLINKKDKLFNN